MPMHQKQSQGKTKIRFETFDSSRGLLTQPPNMLSDVGSTRLADRQVIASSSHVLTHLSRYPRHTRERKQSWKPIELFYRFTSDVAEYVGLYNFLSTNLFPRAELV
jgi:hypothetical protein